MELEIGLTVVLLVVLCVLATVDMAFGQVSDVGLHRLSCEAYERSELSSKAFLKQVLENRARFGFAISATIQILLVIVAVLITSVSLSVFSDPRFVLVGLVAGLILAGVFRQLVPLFVSARNPEATLLFLLPVIRPFFPLMAFIADPFQKLFDRSHRKEQMPDDGTDAEEEDDGGDLQALIDVGEAEGILEEEEGELIQSIIEFGDTRVSEVMTPRPDIVALPDTATVREARDVIRSEEHTSELQSRPHLVCRLLLEKKNKIATQRPLLVIRNPSPSIDVILVISMSASLKVIYRMCLSYLASAILCSFFFFF